MAKTIAMYKRPVDPAEFDRYYYATHVPLAKRIPGLRKYEVTAGPVTTPAGASPYHLVALLTVDSVAAINAALESAQGQATAADLPNFATGGVELFIADTRAI